MITFGILVALVSAVLGTALAWGVVLGIDALVRRIGR